jgi:hypothetical protein
MSSSEHNLSDTEAEAATDTRRRSSRRLTRGVFNDLDQNPPSARARWLVKLTSTLNVWAATSWNALKSMDWKTNGSLVVSFTFQLIIVIADSRSGTPINRDPRRFDRGLDKT